MHIQHNSFVGPLFCYLNETGAWLHDSGEGRQILTYAWQSWPLSSEGSLTCHTYCDTDLLFMMVISGDPGHSQLLPCVWQWSCHYLFLRLRSVATKDRTPISRTRGECSTSTPPRRLESSKVNIEFVHMAEKCVISLHVQNFFL